MNGFDNHLADDDYIDRFDGGVYAAEATVSSSKKRVMMKSRGKMSALPVLWERRRGLYHAAVPWTKFSLPLPLFVCLFLVIFFLSDAICVES